MLARPIQHEDDLLGGASADHLGKRLSLDLEQRDGDAGGQVEDGAARGRMDETDPMSPGNAMLDRSEGALPMQRPCLAQERLEADAVLVHRPQFNRGLRKGSGDLPL